LFWICGVPLAVFGGFTMTTTQSGTSVQENNVAQVRKGYEAFGAGDMASLMDLFHPDAVWNVPAAGVITGNYRGRDAIFAFFAQTQQEANGTFRAVPVAFAATGDQVFVQQQTSGERNGRSLRSEAVLVFKLDGGRVREVREYFADPHAAEAFWS
jgi:uncharacterized protein